MPVKRREVMERYGVYRSETIFGANFVTSSIRTARFQPAIPARLSDDNGITESVIIAPESRSGVTSQGRGSSLSGAHQVGR